MTITEDLYTRDNGGDKARNFITAGEDAYDIISLIERDGLLYPSSRPKT